MSLYLPVSDPLLRFSLRRVLHLWKPMAAWILLVWLAAALLLAPITTMVLGLEIFQGEDQVIGNEELVKWLTRPAGILYVVIAGALGLVSSVIQFAGIFDIVSGDLNGRSPALKATAMRTLRSVPRLFKACFFAVAAMIVLFTPLAAGFTAIYHLWLSEHDINFYLVIQPHEWYYALATGVIWSLIWLTGVLYLTGRTLLALPAYLANDYTIAEAVVNSWFLAKDRTFRLLRLMGSVLVVWLIAGFAMETLLLFTASRTLSVVAAISPSVRLVVLTIALFISLSVFISMVISFFGFSFAATVLTKFYYENTDLHIKSKPAPGFRAMQAGLAEIIEPWLAPVRIIPLIALAGTASLAASSFWLNRLPEPRNIHIAAHRAGPPPAPENTFAALEQAVSAGADFSEIDVQRARDGTVVLVHDADLMRVAGVPLKIAETDYEDLKDIVQRPDDGSPPSERKVATLPDILERAEGRIRLIIELKYHGFDPLLAEEVVDIIREYEMEDQVILMSLDLNALRQIRQLSGAIRTGYISTIMIGNISRMPADILAVNRQAVSAAFLRNARRRNMDVYAWTINRGDKMAELIELGVDGLITDDPALAVRVQEELYSMTAVERLLLRFHSLILEPEMDTPR